MAGRYRLEQMIGRGGMGTVWAATHAVTGARVALKLLLGSQLGSRPELRARFLAEARAASAIDHPNVIRVHDVFEQDDGVSVMVLDLLEGETLSALLSRQERLSASDAAAILVPVLDAVMAAHEKGVVHRDLKPENVFLERGAGGASTPKVLDFGIAKLLDAGDGAVVTSTGAMLGTAGYMAPEQGFGERDVDARADVWALGVIAYECLSGMRPVEGENLGQYLKRLMSDAITPLEVVAPDVPRELAAVITGMLAVDRDERLGDLSLLRSALERAAADASEADGDGQGDEDLVVKSRVVRLLEPRPDRASLVPANRARRLVVFAAPLVAACALVGLLWGADRPVDSAPAPSGAAPEQGTSGPPSAAPSSPPEPTPAPSSRFAGPKTSASPRGSGPAAAASTGAAATRSASPTDRAATPLPAQTAGKAGGLVEEPPF